MNMHGGTATATTTTTPSSAAAATTTGGNGIRIRIRIRVMPCRYRPMAKRKQLELLPNVLRVHAHYAQETSVSTFRSPLPPVLLSCPDPPIQL